ncbi:MAG: hypothetical protein HY013_00495 [Candidatus Solibacter usitatus]|nr:hypothetical protein [Candidatus Solibacter usitatus]
MHRMLLPGWVVAMGIAWPQSGALVCTPSAIPQVLRGEGLAERMGDIAMDCAGGTPGSVINGNLTVFLSVNITNKLTASGAVDAVLTVDSGSGPVAQPAAQLVSSNSIVFLGVNFTLPASGRAAARLSNLRGNLTQVALGFPLPITANLAGTLNFALSASQVIVGYPYRGLLASYSSTGVRCTGSPLPSTIGLSNLFATGTRFFSTRVTEGHAEAFTKKDAFGDSGVRIVARYSGFPFAARLFVPDVVAGSSAFQPTGGGDLGVTQSGGIYMPGAPGSLLLVRVTGTDSNGAGGTLVYAPGPPGSGAVGFDGATEVPLVDGAGIAVYEVVDSNPSVLETAQFPTFLGLSPFSSGIGTVARQDLSLGPISTVATASAVAPAPRFTANPPPGDCTALQDCDARYFPRLTVNGFPPQFVALQGSAPQTRYLQINNISGGLLNWTATVVYKNGAGWLRIEPDSGFGDGTLRVDANPGMLAAGTYEATIVVDAGPIAGTKNVPVTMVVTALPPPPPPPAAPKVVVTSIGNSARPDSSTVAPGSRARLEGSGFVGQSTVVTFDGIVARLLSVEATRIELEVPPLLGMKTSAILEVIVDSDKSGPKTAPLAEVAPAIYPDGVLNADNSVNSLGNPALVGSAFQIFTTGAIAVQPGPVQVKLHDRFPKPLYAGPAPLLIGINQINVPIPDDLPAMQSEILVCGFATINPGVPICSRPATIWLYRAE